MNKKWIFAITILAALALFSGGTDAVDINRMIFVVGVGVDKEDSGSRYTFYTAVPIGSDTAVSENNVQYQAVTLPGESFASAVRQLELGSSRDISFDHLNCTAIGKSAANEDLSVLIDYLMRDTAVRKQCTVFTLDCPAEDFFSSRHEGSIAAAASSALEQLDDSDSRQSIMTLGRLHSDLSAGNGFCLYILGLESKPPDVSQSDVNGASSIRLRGLNVYSSDGSGGTLDDEQAELTRLFTDRQVSGLITSIDNSGHSSYFEITYSRCRLDFEPGEPCRARIDIEVECRLIDSGGMSGRIPDNNELAEHLHEKLYSIIELSRIYGAAIIGIDTEARQSHRLWYNSIRDRWNEIYKNTDIELAVNCTIERQQIV